METSPSIQESGISIDQAGIVRLALVDADSTRRLEPATLLTRLRAVVEEK